MARRRNIGPRLVKCEDCVHNSPVTHEFPAWDGRPIFCTCPHKKYYQELRHPKPCEYYNEKQKTL